MVLTRVDQDSPRSHSSRVQDGLSRARSQAELTSLLSAGGRSDISIRIPNSASGSSRCVDRSSSESPPPEDVEAGQREQRELSVEVEDLKRDLCQLLIIAIISGLIVAWNVYGVLSSPYFHGRFPRALALEEIQQLSKSMSEYTQKHFTRMLTVLMMLGSYFNTFMIPGGTLVNIIAGSQFGFRIGMLVVICYSTIGVTLAYLMTRSFGQLLLKSRFRARIDAITSLFQADNDTPGTHNLNLLIYITSLRLFPFTPTWLLNISLASLGVPLAVYIASYAIGSFPYMYVAVQAGPLLSEITSTEVVPFNMAVQFGAIAVAGVALPTIITRLGRLAGMAQPAATNPTTTNGPGFGYYWMQAQKVGYSTPTKPPRVGGGWCCFASRASAATRE